MPHWERAWVPCVMLKARPAKGRLHIAEMLEHRRTGLPMACVPLA